MRSPPQGIHSLLSFPLLLIAVVVVVVAFASPSPSRAEDPAELTKHRAAFNSALLEIDIKLQTQQKAILANYLKALTRLEQERQAEGNSSAVAAIQQEKARVTGSDTGPAADPLAGQTKDDPKP